MEDNIVFKVFLKGDVLIVKHNNNLLYSSRMIEIVKRIKSLSKSVGFDLFVFSEILEFNDSIINMSFEFSKAFLYFAKEYNRYESYRN